MIEGKEKKRKKNKNKNKMKEKERIMKAQNKRKEEKWQ